MTGAVGCGEPIVDPAGRTAELTAAWTKFRQRFPFHVQTIALGRGAGAGDRVLILSEPAPHVTLTGLAKLGAGALQLIETRRHALGHDGWVKDIVAKTGADDATLQKLVGKLARWLYATDYKTYVYDLDRPGRERPPARLDLRISAPEIAAWLVAGGEGFVPLAGGAEQPLEKVFANPRSAVYLSAAPGLVAWWLPAAEQVAAARGQVRQFALDSDLVIGAVSGEAGVLILGRERQAPLDVLPPLRAETIALLDRANPRQLGQSYERKHVLAGRRDERSDWAPIYLSPELVDTEYGSLLNITDQMLKSWSNCGLTRYADFPYPDPPGWPFPEPVLPNATTVTYNWNTRGAAYLTSAGGYDLLALNRTGALPVSYIPGEALNGELEVQAAEERAYGYFAGLSDPNLVRVVQYAALYQILKASRPSTGARAGGEAGPPAAPLAQVTFAVLTQARALTPAQMRQAIDLTQRQALAAGAGSRAAAAHAQRLIHLREELAAESAADFHAFAARLASPRSRQDFALREKYRPLASCVAALTKVDQKYAGSMKGAGWIHTSVVVVSHNTGELAGAEGGHNLYSHATRFRDDAEVGSGSVKVLEEDGNQVVLVNPADAAKLPEIVKIAGREWDSAAEAQSEIGRVLADAQPVALRTQAAALELDAPAGSGVPPGRGFDLTDAGPFRRVGRWGHEPVTLPAGHPLRGALQTLRQRSANSYVLARGSDGTIIVAYGEGGLAVKVFSSPDANNLVMRMARGASPGEPLLIDLHGWTFDEAEGWMKTFEIREGAPEAQRDVTGVVRYSGRLAGGVEPRLDFSRATLSQAVVERAGGHEVSYELAVPRMAEVRPSLLIRIKTFFAGIADAARIDAFGQVLRARLSALVGATPRNGFDLGLELHKEIHAVAKEQGVDIRQVRQLVASNAIDVHIVRMEDQDGCPWAIAAASRQIVAHLPSPFR